MALPATALSSEIQELVPNAPNRVACFAVVSDADPGVLPRLLAPFTKRALVPMSVNCHRLDAADRLATIIVMDALTLQEADHLAMLLRTIPLVHEVVTAEAS